MNKKSIDIFNDARCNEGEPIYEAFDNKEEYERAYEIYEAWLMAEMKRWDEFRKLYRTDPEAARAAAEASRARGKAAARAEAKASRARSKAASRATTKTSHTENEVAPKEAPEPHSS